MAQGVDKRILDLAEMINQLEQLTYPASLPKLELTANEIQDLTKSKLKAILGGNDPDEALEEALKAITPLLALSSTRTGDRKLDQRKSRAILQHFESGTIPDQITTPQKAASQSERYVEEQTKAYHEGQATLFSLLKGYNTAFDDLKVSGEILERADGSKLTFVQFCNTLDEITKTFLLYTDIQDRSITSGTYDRYKIRELYNSCFAVAAGRIVVSFTFDDNILNVTSFLRWAKHVHMITSFVALAVALQKLLS